MTVMNVFEATSTLLTRANHYAIRPNGINFRLSRTSYAIRADRPPNSYMCFCASDLLADDWEVKPIPAESQPGAEISNG